MKKNLYYAAVYKRRNIIKMNILSFFLVISSYPRLLLEVFLRRNMGERYFTLASAATALIIFGALPIMLFNQGLSGWEVITHQKLYYAFLAAFGICSALRYIEILREPSVFDMARMSTSAGKIWPGFKRIRLFGKPASIRTIEIWLEPLAFFIAGLLLLTIESGILLGFLLIFCSVVYSFSHSGAYLLGDQFIMDRIDEIIANEDLSEAFVKDEESARGFRWYGRKPTSEELREEYVEDICFEEANEETEAR